MCTFHYPKVVGCSVSEGPMHVPVTLDDVFCERSV